MFYDSAINLFRKTTPIKVLVALMTLEKYVNGAIIQWDRIQVDQRMLPGKGPGVDKTIIETLFLDVHFYFVCCDKTQNLIKYLVNQTNDPILKAIWKKYSLAFKSYNDARNHLEHIETRITDKYTRDFGNISGHTYTFGGERYDIGETGLKQLASIYEEVLSALAASFPSV